MRRPYPTAIPPLIPLWLPRAAALSSARTGRTMVMEEVTEEPAELVERVAALRQARGRPQAALPATEGPPKRSAIGRIASR
jgi:hypothetical protein